jgi:hypothetical protein
MLNIAIDFHGVIEDYPDVYKPLMIMLCGNSDSTVYILSGAPKLEIESCLIDLKYERGIHYNDILSIVDWLKHTRRPMFCREGHWYSMYEDDWWKSKAQICNKYKIDILIDDREKYADHLYGDYPKQFFLTKSIFPEKIKYDHTHPNQKKDAKCFMIQGKNYYADHVIHKMTLNPLKDDQND